MIKQSTSIEGTILYLKDAWESKQLIETIDVNDIINIDDLVVFPKSLINGHPIKKQISKNNYTVKVVSDIPILEDGTYNTLTKEYKKRNSNEYLSYSRFNSNIIYYCKISTEPNIKIVSANEFYRYFNSLNEDISTEEVKNIILGFNGNKEDTDFAMKQLCYYNLNKHKSHILIKYCIDHNNPIFSSENVYTKYIRNFIGATTDNAYRIYSYTSDTLCRVFKITNESDIELMREYLNPVLREEIRKNSFYLKYIKCFNLVVKFVEKGKIINNSNCIPKEFIDIINIEYNNTYNESLTLTNQDLCFVQDI